MPVELWKAIFDWSAVILVGLTMIAGAGALITGKKISDLQSEQLQKFDSGLTKAKSDLATQQERAAAADAQVAGLVRENLILQQKLANRRISKEQHKILVDFLSKRPGQIIIETMGDSESGLFASDILKTFEDSGWTIGGKNFPLGVIWTGLIVYNSDDPDALTVAEAFKAAGIPFAIGNEKRAKATIMVGGRPAIF